MGKGLQQAIRGPVTSACDWNGIFDVVVIGGGPRVLASLQAFFADGRH